MKPFIIAIAALGLVGSIGTANATPDTSTSIAIWNVTTGGVLEGDATQQALPSAATAIQTAITGGKSGFTLATTPYSAAINYNLPTFTSSPNNDTVPGFLASNQTSPVALGACTGSCSTDTLSSGQGGGPTAPNFDAVTLFEFVFTPTSTEFFTVTHDDGVSLFSDGDTITNLLPGQSGPTSSEVSQTITLTGGQAYDLWYTAANGLPEVLETNTVPVPAPPIGHGLPVLLVAGGILFGAKLWDRSKRRSPLGTAALNAA